MVVLSCAAILSVSTCHQDQLEERRTRLAGCVFEESWWELVSTWVQNLIIRRCLHLKCSWQGVKWGQLNCLHLSDIAMHSWQKLFFRGGRKVIQRNKMIRFLYLIWSTWYILQMKIACGTILSHVCLHSRVYVLTHIKEVCSSTLPVVKDCRKVCVGNVLLFAELPKLSHTLLTKLDGML